MSDLNLERFVTCCGIKLTSPDMWVEHLLRCHADPAPAASEGGIGTRCGCSASTGICGCVTYGSGKLDDHGFWEIVCPHGSEVHMCGFVASVEGQRTGEPQGPLCDNCGKTSREHLCYIRGGATYHPSELRSTSVPDVEGTQCACCSAMLTELVEFTKCPENEDVVEHIKKLLSPVEGMGARGWIAKYIPLQFEDSKTTELDQQQLEQILEAYAEETHAIIGGICPTCLTDMNARSLRGAGGEREPDGDSLRRRFAALNNELDLLKISWNSALIGEDDALRGLRASESREQAMRECLGKIQEFAEQRPFIIGLEGVSEMCKAALKP